jgi:putative peptidoglycan lipid II flippase
VKAATAGSKPRARRSSLLATIGRVAPWQAASRASTALLPFLLATWFGRSEATDLYTLIAAVFALAGSLVFASFQDSALVPIAVDVERRDPAEMPRLAGALFAYTAAIGVALAALVASAAGLWFRARAAPAAAALVAPMVLGFALQLPFLALRSLASALLAARFRFVPDAVAGLAGVATTVALAAGGRRLGLAAVPFAIAGGEVVAASWLVVALYRAGLPIVRLLTWARPPALRRFVRLVSAEIGGSAVVRVNPIVDQLVAGTVGIVGGGTMLRLTGDLAGMPAALLGSTFLSVLLSHLSIAGAEGRRREVRRTVVRSVLVVAGVLGVAAALLFVARVPVVRLIYGRGVMDASALDAMARILPYHLIGLAPFGVLLVLVRAHVSLGNSRIMAGMGLANAGVNLALDLVLGRVLGLGGIALATSLVNVVVAGVFWLRFVRCLRRRAVPQRQRA